MWEPPKYQLLCAHSLCRYSLRYELPTFGYTKPACSCYFAFVLLCIPYLSNKPAIEPCRLCVSSFYHTTGTGYFFDMFFFTWISTAENVWRNSDETDRWGEEGDWVLRYKYTYKVSMCTEFFIRRKKNMRLLKSKLLSFSIHRTNSRMWCAQRRTGKKIY